MANIYERFEAGEFKNTGTKKLTWQGRNINFPVVKINIDELKYNILNGRIAELDLTGIVELDKATYSDIKNSIVGRSKSDIEKLGKDIGKAKLKEPLIINREGIIVDGNRRYTAINMLLGGEIKPFSPSDVTDLEFVDVVVLDADSTEKSVKMLEYSIQYDDMKKSYDPISRAFDFARSHKVQKMSIAEIVESTGIKKIEIEKDIRTVELIRVYLAAINAKDNISLAIKLKLDGPFKEFASSPSNTNYFKQNQVELVNLMTAAKQEGGDVTRFVRDFVKGVGAGAAKENITNSPRVKQALEKIVKAVDIPRVIRNVASAKTNEEKVNILTNQDVKKSNKISKTVNSLKDSLLSDQKLIKTTNRIETFKLFVEDIEWHSLSAEDKKLLNQIAREIDANK